MPMEPDCIKVTIQGTHSAKQFLELLYHRFDFSQVSKCFYLRNKRRLRELPPVLNMSHVELPPDYESINQQPQLRGSAEPAPAPDGPRGQIFEEDEYGEMKPSQTGQIPKDLDGNPVQSAHLPRGTVFSENEYGEMSEGDRNATGESRSANINSISPGNFGKDTQGKSEEFRSDQVYPENRFGELGKADTQSEGMSKPSAADKVKGE